MKIAKRELSTAILLYKLYGEESVNIGLVIDTIKRELGVTRRTAVNIVRRLRKLGFLVVESGDVAVNVRLRNPCLVIEEYALNYLKSRKSRLEPQA